MAVSADGKRISLPVDHRIDLNNLEIPVSFVEIQTKDGRQQLSTKQYRALVLERTETANKKIISTHDETGRDIDLEFRPAQYIRYIGERPGAEKFENGEALFDLAGAVKIEDAQETAKQLQGNIWWSQIVSLPRAEATRTGYDHREAWQNLVRARAPDIAKAYNISLENLVLNCAYHNKELNPHIHLFITSKNKRESFVLGGKDGMAKASKRIKSLFFNEIFKGDVAFLKEQKNVQEQALDDQLTAALKRISSKGYTPNDALTARLFSFAEKLQEVKGRKVYGYLPPELKLEVNEILRLAVADGQLQPLFSSYMETQRAFIENYVDNPETIAEKLMEAEQRFFEPGKRDNKELHNVIVGQVALLQAEQQEMVKMAAHAHYVTKNTLCSLAGLLHSFTKEQQLFNRQQSEKKPVRNIGGQQQRRKKWRNFIEN